MLSNEIFEVNTQNQNIDLLELFLLDIESIYILRLDN